MTITRQAIAAHLSGAFDDDGATREELIAAAEQSGAGPEVLTLLNDLKLPHYRELRQIWIDLHQVPLDDSPALSGTARG